MTHVTAPQPHSSNECEVLELPTSTSKFTAIIGVIGFVGLIVPEIWFFVVAFIWSIQGLFHLSILVTGIIAAIIALPAIWASYYVLRAAIAVEFPNSKQIQS